jgi:twitching motility two-component system response regulator PilH
MRGKRVLIVDDNPRILDEVVRMLAEEGCEVHTTDQPATVVEEAGRIRPHVILLDILMPGKNGYDVFEELHDEPTTSGIPVVIMTAKAVSLKMPAYLLQELAGMISKPFSKYQLIHGLRTALEKKGTGSESPSA